MAQIDDPAIAHFTLDFPDWCPGHRRVLGELMPQVGHAQPVFFYEMPVLCIEQLRLFFQKCRRIPRNFRIAARQLGGHGRGKCLSASERLRSLYFRLLLSPPSIPPSIPSAMRSPRFLFSTYVGPRRSPWQPSGRFALSVTIKASTSARRPANKAPASQRREFASDSISVSSWQPFSPTPSPRLICALSPQISINSHLFHTPSVLDGTTLPPSPIHHGDKGASMNHRNQQQTNRTPAPAAAPAPTYLNVFTVEELENNGRKAKSWSKIPAAFPIDGRLIVLPPDNDENRSNR